MVSKKNIRNPRRYLHPFNEGDVIRIGIKLDEQTVDKAIKVGFLSDFVLGEAVLPDASLSKAAHENSEGKCLIRKDLPKELAQRYWEWEWKDFGGNCHSDFKYIDYYRYVREYLEPKAFEILIATNERGDKWIVSDAIAIGQETNDDLKLIMNLFLSLFGGFEVLDSEINIPVKSNRTCEWEILKQGTSHKEVIENIEKIIDKHIPKSKRNLYKRNTTILQKTCPDVIAIGTKGFSGYIVFNYPQLGIAVLESLMPNNATYILDSNWEDISKLSKTEVLNKKLQRDRIYHYSNWEEKMGQYIQELRRSA